MCAKASTLPTEPHPQLHVEFEKNIYNPMISGEEAISGVSTFVILKTPLNETPNT